MPFVMTSMTVFICSLLWHLCSRVNRGDGETIVQLWSGLLWSDESPIGFSGWTNGLTSLETFSASLGLRIFISPRTKSECRLDIKCFRWCWSWHSQFFWFSWTRVKELLSHCVYNLGVSLWIQVNPSGRDRSLENYIGLYWSCMFLWPLFRKCIFWCLFFLYNSRTLFHDELCIYI